MGQGVLAKDHSEDGWINCNTFSSLDDFLRNQQCTRRLAGERKDTPDGQRPKDDRQQ